jgi:hypothetical protein
MFKPSNMSPRGAFLLNEQARPHHSKAVRKLFGLNLKKDFTPETLNAANATAVTGIPYNYNNNYYYYARVSSKFLVCFWRRNLHSSSYFVSLGKICYLLNSFITDKIVFIKHANFLSVTLFCFAAELHHIAFFLVFCYIFRRVRKISKRNC